LAAVHPLQPVMVVAGIAAIGGVRPPTEGARAKRSGSRYVLGDLLGRGGMAEVFAGHAVGDHGFQKPVAIKRLLPELANDEVFVERLIEEAKLLVGMQHGNIVSVLDLAREGDDVFLVMEFVDGPSLRQLFKARGARGLSLGVATYIVQSAAGGLEFAHARPGGAIIHADVSPSNLLLTTSGEVRVADFGIARREGLGQGVVEGKWAYMAPEQARGEPLSPRSDVFALGVVMYELLTGQHPFGRAVTANERDDQMRVIPPRVVKPTVPLGLDTICMRALAHDARERYGRMQQLIDALVEERFASGYREGASDLAQAIREVAPKSDVGSPRTMHTDRPVTIVTRSLLREVTPVRRPSYPIRPLGPLDPPPRDAFPPVPTMDAQTAARIADPPPPPPDEFAAGPASGAQTTARVFDQVALAHAADVAAALLEIPAMLRADGTPMPPFRLSQVALPGDELASVVGGHTFTGRSAAAAADGSSPRWAIGVLAAAALFGVIAAVASQVGPDRTRAGAAIAAVQGHGSPHRSAEDPTTKLDGLVEAAPSKPDRAAEVARQIPTFEPTISDTLPPAKDPAPAHQEATRQDATRQDATRQDAARQDAAPAHHDGAAEPSHQGNAPAPKDGALAPHDTAAHPDPAPAHQDGAGERARPEIAAPDGAATPSDGAAAPRDVAPNRRDAPPSDDPGSTGADGARGQDSPRRPARKTTAVKDTSKRKPDGFLSVQTVPWAWVTVGSQTKETPSARFTLPPGSHVVKLYNSENGVTKTRHVVIESGKMKNLNERMDQ